MHSQAHTGTRSPLLRISTTVLFLAAAASIGTAHAAPPKAGTDIRQQFVNFGDQIIDGHIKGPSGTLHQTRKAAAFGRMLTWKKRSFLPRLVQDGQTLR